MFYSIDELQRELEKELNNCKELYVDYQSSKHAVMSELESGHHNLSFICNYDPIITEEYDMKGVQIKTPDTKPTVFSVDMTFENGRYSDSILLTIEGCYKDKKTTNILRITDDNVEFVDEDEDFDEDDDEDRIRVKKPAGKRNRILAVIDSIADLCRIKLMNIIGADPDEFEYDDEDE